MSKSRLIPGVLLEAVQRRFCNGKNDEGGYDSASGAHRVSHRKYLPLTRNVSSTVAQ